MKTIISAAAIACFALPVMAQDIVELRSLGTGLAVEIATATVAACAADGHNVAAAVTDRAGILLALVRAETAGNHTAAAATAKAYTSAASRNPTSGMAKTVAENPGAAGLADIPGFLVLAGGVPVRAGDQVIGAVGVGGAPGGHLDEACANKALDQFADRLK